jgi:AcrR family transcriptional regulator
MSSQQKTTSKKTEQPVGDEERSAAGRPRCPLAHAAILAAARELLAEVGFADLTIEGVAARAGVGKTTIYRRWTNKASLVMDAFFSCASPKLAFPDTGSLREDLRRQMRAFVRELNSEIGQALKALLAGAQTDAELAAAFRHAWIEARRVEAREVLSRAVERGELCGKLDQEVLLDALYGAVYFRLLTEHGALTPSFVDKLIDLVLTGTEAES